MHEHVFVLQPEALQNYGHVWGASYWDEEVRIRDAIVKLGALRAAGIRTLVDPTAPGLGRYIPRIQRVAAEVDLNIVVATGVYAFLELPNFLGYRSVDAIAELFVRELRRGHRRHGRQGRVPQVRRRTARRRRRRAADPRCDRRRGDRDRRTGHGAHQCPRGDGLSGAPGADVEGRRPHEDRHRPRGRQQRPDVFAGDRGHGSRPWLRPLQHPPLQPRRRPDPNAARAPRGGIRRPCPPLARRRLLLRLHGRRPELRR